MGPVGIPVLSRQGDPDPHMTRDRERAVEDARSASGELAMSSTPVSVSLGAPSLTLEACSFSLPPMGLSPVASECTSGAVPPSGGQEDPLGGPGPSGSLIAIGFSRVSRSNPHH